MDIVKGKFGEVRFCDCLDDLYGIESLEGNYDLCITDPPYNVSLKANSQAFISPADQKISYSDNMTEDQYMNWCDSWFQAVKKKTKLQVISIGHPNLANWIRYIGEPKDYIIHYKPDGHGIGSMSYYIRGEIWFVYGSNLHGLNRKPFHTNVIEGSVNSGFFKREKGLLKHPCPKSYEFCKTAILQSRAKSAVELFAGSGTMPEIFEELGIKYIGFEINPEYKQDIKLRIQQGIKNYNPVRSKKLLQV